MVILEKGIIGGNSDLNMFLPVQSSLYMWSCTESINISHDGEGTHELSNKVESFRGVNETLSVDVNFAPGLVESFVHVFFSVLFWQVVPFLNDIRWCIPCVFFSENVYTSWVTSFISALLGIRVKYTFHVVVVFGRCMLLTNSANLVHFGVGIVEFFIRDLFSIFLILFH